QRVRTIVNIPLPQKPPPANVAPLEEARAAAESARRSPYATVRDHAPQAGVVEATEIKRPGKDALRTRRMDDRVAERGFFDSLQAVMRSDWLRRAFIVLLFAAVVGLASSIYHYYAEKPVPGIFENGKDGVIDGAVNVNLRSEPGGAVLSVLPVNSRVRLLEERGNWVRVRVLNWAGGPPAGAPDSGWVNKSFVKTD